MNLRRRGPLLLLLAVICLLPVFAKPRWWTPGPTFRYLLVLDVSQSMNVRDADRLDPERSRLQLGRQALLEVLEALPCGSQVSVALFAEGQTLPLFDPLEVCDHYPAMERVLSGVHWRMAWAGNSQIDMGLSSALQEAQRHQLDLIFVTDGDQTPHRRAQRLGTLQGQRGQARGWVVGVGGDGVHRRGERHLPHDFGGRGRGGRVDQPNPEDFVGEPHMARPVRCHHNGRLASGLRQFTDQSRFPIIVQRVGWIVQEANGVCFQEGPAKRDAAL